ncbi:DNA replication complex GINS protein PSF3 [Biomphalaria glabrata]|uniref:DNA replication complex GINS protein PSF3 n=2 Tax=Biomphalaria TaxID=6525 RepID=A0A9W3ASQ2_BIOGL|nr:DNA replication complex GINS protein PSF3-like [Biomphalaria glabrata]KAI8759334.1 DNA replication complex GINS protein PSF3 isoform X2 [Biomphalaria glabrata]KAI8761999.1 DNA replication complex GINS protein PSF3 isoform X2 [Biomphalaria glabrata]KAK0046407.1 DNA replication complex GINS protein PSF3 isoform X2 [Biomphalaria pfeifferi]
MAANFTLDSNPDSYFSLDDILASQEKVPCTFNTQVSNMGYMDQSTTDTNIVSGTKLELPFWLAKSLDRGSRSIINIDTPKNYKEVYRQIFTADPNVVDLHKLGPYFYLFGGKLISLHLPDNDDIASVLLKTFQGRFRRIMDGSQNTLNVDLTSQVSLLDEQERLLFSAGQQGLHDFQKWETRESEKLSTSTMVANHRKRKRFVLSSKSS